MSIRWSAPVSYTHLDVYKRQQFVKTKKYVPSSFFQKKQIEMLRGVYFPFWICECKTEDVYKRQQYYIVTDRWQKFTDVILSEQVLDELSEHLSLIHILMKAI